MSEIFIFLRVFNKKKSNTVNIYNCCSKKKRKEIRTLFNIWTKNIRKKLTKEGI